MQTNLGVLCDLCGSTELPLAIALALADFEP
jgi:hypothetical protein